MQTVAISGQSRENLGKKASKSDRREGLVPAVIYGAGDPVHFSVEPLAVRDLIYTPDFKVAELTIGGKIQRAIVKDIQFHPVTDAILHLDFLALQEGHPIRVSVPVGFKGVSPGVKAGGKLLQAVREIKIKAIPENLIDHITMDISKMELGQAIRVRDIDPIDGVEIINPGGQPVALIEIPRALRSAATAAKKAEQAASKKGGKK